MQKVLQFKNSINKKKTNSRTLTFLNLNTIQISQKLNKEL